LNDLFRDIFASHTAHELGHCLGLNHTEEDYGISDEFSDTYYPDYIDGDANWCNCYTDLNCSNNIMRTKGITKNHLSPRQIGKMRRQIIEGYNAKYFDICYINEPTTIISANEDWDKIKIFYSNVEIRDSAVVNLYCNTYMPPNKSITIMKNSKLV
jgi:hypothetical protein